MKFFLVIRIYSFNESLKKEASFETLWTNRLKLCCNFNAYSKSLFENFVGKSVIGKQLTTLWELSLVCLGNITKPMKTAIKRMMKDIYN